MSRRFEIRAAAPRVPGSSATIVVPPAGGGAAGGDEAPECPECPDCPECPECPPPGGNCSEMKIMAADIYSDNSCRYMFWLTCASPSIVAEWTVEYDHVDDGSRHIYATLAPGELIGDPVDNIPGDMSAVTVMTVGNGGYCAGAWGQIIVRARPFDVLTGEYVGPQLEMDVTEYVSCHCW